MTSYTRDEVGYLDIAWLGVDGSGKIGHFLTGLAGRPPHSIINNKEENELTIDNLQYIPLIAHARLIENLPDGWKFLDGGETFWRFHKNIAEKGLFSFDVACAHSDLSISYLCVAAPDANWICADKAGNTFPLLDRVSCQDIFYELGGIVRPKIT